MREMRYVATIRQTDLHPSTRHAIGLPIELANGIAEPTPMPWPFVVLIHHNQSGIFLDRYTRDGQPAGDTWHKSVAEAKEQAAEEYDGMLGQWIEVPDDVQEDRLIAFASENSR